ncbi:MAG: hypothetical protein KGM96_00435 [Acidobacteriota bacterium]|nr:hypothetical protein [Acidobacteriota bacterium]
MRTLVFLPLVALLACGPHAATIASAAQSGDFTVSLAGKPVGTANYHFTPTGSGYNSTSLVKVNMKGLTYAFSKTEQLSQASQLQHVELSATINDSAVNVTGAPDSAQFLLNMSANGRSSTTRLAKQPAAVFMPDFDPGAFQTLLTLGRANNNRDLYVIIPKNQGSIVPVELATYADEQGTFNGQPVTVHHLVATISGSLTDLFAGPDNQLLQAELPQEGFALIRNGFVLKPPAKPLAPPAPPPGVNQQPGTAQPPAQ